MDMNKTEDCLFCKIVDGSIPSKKIYEDESVLAFNDIAPQAKTHFLVIPKQHLESAAVVSEENSFLVSKCFEAIAKIAKQEKLDNGFRVITNCGRDGAQSVLHLHFHILAGELLPHNLV
jgi:histidine triad (HIT) family protein